jgi:hypothetical protein
MLAINFAVQQHVLFSNLTLDVIESTVLFVDWTLDEGPLIGHWLEPKGSEKQKNSSRDIYG